MTVSSETSRKTFTGDGATVSFATSPMVFFAAADLDVYVVTTATGASTTLTLNTHYTVTGGDGSTGTVLTSGGSSPYGAPSAAQTLVIVRDVAITQGTDLVNNDNSDAEVLEDGFDRLTMIAQQADQAIDRSFKLLDSDVTGASTTLPTPVASKLIGWDSAGTALRNYAATDFDTALTTAFSLTLLDDATAAEARTTLGAAQKVITTKGDLHVGGAAGAESRKAVGATNGMALVADSAQADGLLWAALAFQPGGRVTLTTAVPVTTADVSGAATVYYSPYKHNVVMIYDGSGWIPKVFAELSQTTADSTKSPAAVANNSNYDVFVWNDSGTLRATRGPAWTSDTARGTGAGTTELEQFEGRYVNKVAITNGPAARRGLYVGSVRSDGSAQINDTKAKRHGWNTYNRIGRPLQSPLETADTWTYTTATYRQANNNTANQFNFLIGLSEDAVSASVHAAAANDGAAGSANFAVGIGIDSSTVNSKSLASQVQALTTGVPLPVSAHYKGFPGIGSHDLRWLEWSTAAGTTTWRGDSGAATEHQSGIIGEIMA